MPDPEIIRLVISIEERDFECKLTYFRASGKNLDLWWLDKQPDLKEWLEQHGHETLVQPVCTCAMRMLTPLRAMIKSGGTALTPTEAPSEAVKWFYGVKRAERNNIVMEATDGKRKVVIDYQTTIDKTARAVVVHASMRMDDKLAIAKSEFSYKADARMSGVAIWTLAQKAIHAQAAETQGIPGEPASKCFDKAMEMCWQGVRDAMDEKHEKKTKAKDADDSKLFDLDGI